MFCAPAKTENKDRGVPGQCVFNVTVGVAIHLAGSTHLEIRIDGSTTNTKTKILAQRCYNSKHSNWIWEQKTKGPRLTTQEV